MAQTWTSYNLEALGTCTYHTDNLVYSLIRTDNKSFVMVQSDIDGLIRRQKSGCTLEQIFYRNSEIHQLEFQRVLSPQWLYVEHESELPNPGDFLTYEIGEESIIIVRGSDRQLHAFFNVCRHRGSRICLKKSGNTRRFVCPYHAWAYDLEGNLLSARHMADDFDQSQHGLHRCQVEVLEGLVFISLASQGNAEFSQIRHNLLPYLKPHGLTQTKIVHREVYPTHANWKLVVENFRECYHCMSAHPEYTQVNDYVRAGERGSEAYQAMNEQFEEVARSKGRKSGMEHFPLPCQPHQVWRLPIQEGYKTLTRDGSPAGPLLGEFEEYDGAETGSFMGALSYLYVTNDHATTFRFTPKSPDFTEVVVAWLVREDAKVGVDYNLDHLKWMWDVTTIQDTKIINNNQKGVNSSHYSPGPYSEYELATANFTAWYLWRLSGRTDIECPTKEARFFYERMS